jgi:hypothetical protein
MTYRQTFVIEYAEPSQAPAVGAGMTMLGGDLVAVQFNDALAEVETLQAEVEHLRSELRVLGEVPF